MALNLMSSALRPKHAFIVADNFGGGTDGLINRVTGELIATTEEREPKELGHSYKAISWTHRFMTCKPAARKF
jgi:hypothetical protein